MQNKDTEIIKKYFLLCTLSGNQRSHVVEQVKNHLAGVLNKKEMEMFFRVQDGNLVPKEIVIGGEISTGDSSKSEYSGQSTGCIIIY